MNYWIRKITLITLCLIATSLSAQDVNSWEQKPVLKLSGFVDVFYIYDFNTPQNFNRQAFVFNHNRHNAFNLNLGLLKLALEHPKYRTNLALHTGTYVNDNYAAEPGLLKLVSEANIGIALNNKNSLWLDVGILPSHLGFESAVSMDNYTLTRSLIAESSPYFLSGAKLTFDPTDKWTLAGLLVNGWQRIQPVQGNSLLSLGTQVVYKPTNAVTLNWSTFIGTDDPDTTRRMRYLSNLFGQAKITDKIDLIAGFDIGAQQQLKGSNGYDIWFSPILIGQYTVNKNWKMAFRIEYNQDEMGIVIPTGTPNGFQTFGGSINLDYAPTKEVLCRVEARWLNSKDNVFVTPTGTTGSNFILGVSIAAKLSEISLKLK